MTTAPGQERGRELGLILATLLVIVGPFVARPFNIDEPVYVWVAEWIVEHPGDFYGFDFNWTGEREPAHVSNENPPLASYAIAAFGALFGWSEAALHTAFLAIAFAAAAGTYQLAVAWTQRPVVAGLAVAVSPAFAVTASLANSDVAMLALFVWALYFWERGLRRDHLLSLLLGGALASLAILAKYFGFAAVLLMAASAIVRRTRPGAWIGCLALPFATLVGYHFLTVELYGQSLVLGAVEYATAYRTASAPPRLVQLVLGLTFVGGGAATVLALAPALRPRWRIGAVLVVSGLAAAWFATWANLGGAFPDGAPAWLAAQIGLWTAVGVSIGALVVADLDAERSADSLLLALWVVGTLVFTSFVNWTTNGRTVLPLIPPIAILLARRIDRVRDRPDGPVGASRWLLPALAATALLSASLVWADARLAISARTAAEHLVPHYAAQGAGVWFEGHWGFQYYAERNGAVALGRRSSRVSAGDYIIVPDGGSYLFHLPPDAIARQEVLELPLPGWVATMNPSAGAGFYAATYGPLPFSIANASPARYRVFRAVRAFDLALESAQARPR